MCMPAAAVRPPKPSSGEICIYFSQKLATKKTYTDALMLLVRVNRVVISVAKF